MSKIFIKTNREPFLVTKSVAEQIMRDFQDEKIPVQTVMTIKHVEGTKLTTKADIRSIDISYSDKDYWERKNEIDPPKQNTHVEIPMTKEEEERSKQAMLRAKDKLREMGFKV